MTAYALCQLQHARDHMAMAINTKYLEDYVRDLLVHCSSNIAHVIPIHTRDILFAVVIPHQGSIEVKYQRDVTDEDRATGTVVENLNFTDAFNASVS